jgi:RimJ/RimL family protein N-acetyltransferase
VILTIFANNPIARPLYESLGFIEFGKLPGGVKLEEGYADHVFMYKRVR